MVITLMSQCSIPATAQEAGLGLDQESLLPPEVIPLDPSAANKMVQSQAQSRAAQMGTGMASQPTSAPGLSGIEPLTPPGQSAGQSAQDFRKAAFDSLNGQGQFAPNQAHQNPNLQSMQGQMGNNPMANNMMANQPAQNAFSGAPGGSQLTQSQWISPPTSQTMAGGGAQKMGRGTKLKGVGHGLGLASSFGGGLFTGAMMMRSSPMSGLGLGMLGVGIAQYGMRNAFRF